MTVNKNDNNEMPHFKYKQAITKGSNNFKKVDVQNQHSIA